MDTKPQRIGIGLLAVALLATTVVGQTEQADASLNLETVVDPPSIIPDTGSAVIKVPWTYSIDQSVIAPAPRTATGQANLIWEAPDCATGVTVTGALSQAILIANDAGSAQKSNFKGEGVFNVQVNLQAPGESPLQCILTAHVEGYPGVKDTPNSQTTVNVRAAYLGLLSVNPEKTIERSGPDKQITYGMVVSNVGNSESNLVFTLLNEDTGSWDPVVPTQILLPSPTKATEGTTQTVNFQVSTPFKNGWNNAKKSFQLEVKPVSTKDFSQEGQPVVVNVLARVKGVYIPGPELALPILAIAGAALYRRRG